MHEPDAQEVTDNEGFEIRALLDTIFRKYGYDFRHYAPASIKRRIQKCMRESQLASISSIQHGILRDRDLFDRLLLDLSVNVTTMFRDPPFFRALRERVLPELAERKPLRVWHAGCSTGEEVYSLAILLREAGLAARSRIYATDLNEVVLDTARQGVLPLRSVAEYTANYQKSGGAGSFGDYYTARYEHAMLDRSLLRHVVFADHNLATDQVFAEVDLVLCRNVLIYFDRELQTRAIGLFADSLSEGGMLCVGRHESLRLTDATGAFADVDPRLRVYRRNARGPGDHPGRHRPVSRAPSISESSR